MLGFLEMRDKALHHIAPRPLVLDILRQTHTTRHGTIDQHAHCSRVRECHIVKCLHEDTQRPHHQGGYQIDQENARRVEMDKEVTWQMLHPILGPQHQYQRHGIAIHHAHQVDKRGIAHESRIGMEYPEAGNAQEHKTGQRVQHLQRILV